MSTKKTKKCFVFDPSTSECRKFFAVSLELEAVRRDFCDNKISFSNFKKRFHELCVAQTELLYLLYDRCMEDSK